jgi:hypothetical protein
MIMADVRNMNRASARQKQGATLERHLKETVADVTGGEISIGRGEAMDIADLHCFAEQKPLPKNSARRPGIDGLFP